MCLRGDLSSQNTTVLPNTTSYLSYLCAEFYLSVTYQNMSFLRFYLMCRLSKMGSKNKWWRTTWVLAKRAGGRGAKALAHIIFLFSALIKQSACHCSKVNRLTFKYTVVSGATCPQRRVFFARENWSTPLYLLLKSLFSPLTIPRFLILWRFYFPIMINQEILFLKWSRAFFCNYYGMLEGSGSDKPVICWSISYSIAINLQVFL